MLGRSDGAVCDSVVEAFTVGVGNIDSFAIEDTGAVEEGGDNLVALALDTLSVTFGGARTDSRLMSQADSASGKLTELCQEEYWVAATEEANWLYDRYGYRVLVAGKFQAWLRHRRSGRSDVVVSNGRTIWMMVVENHRKVEKVVYSFGAGDRICREMYA